MRAAERHLLPLLRDTAHAAVMSLADWDETLRLARQARLSALIGLRLQAAVQPWTALPPPVRGALRAAMHHAAQRRHSVLVTLQALERVLPAGVQVTLLKGAAYVAQDLGLSRGRLPNDVDLLVARSALEATEAALQAAGWGPALVDAYDQRYYREWSHELPPLRRAGHELELDLHHTIAPVTSRTRADDGLLFADLQPLPGSRYTVLHPADQIIHAAIHLFQDTELDGRLRDLVDIDGLIRHHLRAPGDWDELLRRAAAHRALPVLADALHYCALWLGTPVPATAARSRSGVAGWQVLDWLMDFNCLPRLPDRAPLPAERLAALLGRVRYHLRRMPPGLLLRHLLHRSWRSLRQAGGRG